MVDEAKLNRRRLLAGIGSTALAGCTSQEPDDGGNELVDVIEYLNDDLEGLRYTRGRTSDEKVVKMSQDGESIMVTPYLNQIYQNIDGSHVDQDIFTINSAGNEAYKQFTDHIGPEVGRIIESVSENLSELDSNERPEKLSLNIVGSRDSRLSFEYSTNELIAADVKDSETLDTFVEKLGASSTILRRPQIYEQLSYLRLSETAHYEIEGENLVYQIDEISKDGVDITVNGESMNLTNGQNIGGFPGLMLSTNRIEYDEGVEIQFPEKVDYRPI